MNLFYEMYFVFDELMGKKYIRKKIAYNTLEKMCDKKRLKYPNR
jgi:hypothetical protein